MDKWFDIDRKKPFKYNAEYTAMVKRTCKCGHVVTIFSRHRREICSHCGAYVYLSKKDEFLHQLKRKGVYESRTNIKSI